MTVIITGTSQGLGSQLATLLQPKLDKFIAINRTPSGGVDEILCDLGSKAALEKAKAALDGMLPEQTEVLFVLNAGDYGADETVSDINPDDLGKLLYTNVFGQLSLVEYLIKAGHKVRLVAISSGMGSVSSSDEPYHYAYSASKASLNLSVRLLKQQYAESLDYLIVDPGWMQTRMGGEGAHVNPADTAAFIAKAIDDSTKWNNPSGMLRATDGGVTAW